MPNVFLTSEAYARLKAAKKGDESFSDVIVENLRQDIDINDFLGSCSEIDAEKLSAGIRRERNRKWSA